MLFLICTMLFQYPLRVNSLSSITPTNYHIVVCLFQYPLRINSLSSMSEPFQWARPRQFQYPLRVNSLSSICCDWRSWAALCFSTLYGSIA